MAAVYAGSRPGATSGLLGLAAERTGDDDPLDLVRALVDLRDLGVAHHALERIVLDVAVAAEHLDALDGDLHRGVGGKELRHRAVLRLVGVVAIDFRAGRVEELARGSG